MPVYQSKKAKARSLMSNSRGLGGVGGYFGVQVAGVAAPGAGSAAANNTEDDNARAVDATDAAAVEGEADVNDHGVGDGDSAESDLESVDDNDDNVDAEYWPAATMAWFDAVKKEIDDAVQLTGRDHCKV